MTPPDRTPYRVAGAGSDLLPCPWCAGAPIHCENHTGQSMFWVMCRTCHVSPGDRPTRAGAITAWNTRAPSSPEIGERVDREAVARIIDPEAWSRRESELALAEEWRGKVGVNWNQLSCDFMVTQHIADGERLIAPSLAKADAIIALSAPSPSADALRPGEALTTMLAEAVRFASWAAGQGICPVDGQPARAPEDFLMDYSDATGETDWETMADRLPGLLVPLPPAGGRE